MSPDADHDIEVVYKTLQPVLGAAGRRHADEALARSRDARAWAGRNADAACAWLEVEG